MLHKLDFSISCKTIRRFCSQSVNYDAFLTNTAKKRQPSPIRELLPLMSEPGMISLAGGVPNPEIFPFKSFSFDVPSKESIINPSTHSNETETLSLNEKELNNALQYGPSKGQPLLYEWIREFHNKMHQIPYNNWDICISTGSQDLITKTMDEILEDGDTIIIEAPTYSGTLAYLRARNLNIISVNMDSNGIIPNQLENILINIQKNNQKMPKMIYVIPTGQNPSGTSYTFERKQIIYEIISKYNILLFEDDPYYFLDFNFQLQNRRCLSFQSIDVDGRVIRTDSFSKILSSGLRLGYISGYSSLIRNIELYMQATCLHTSCLSQIIVYKLLDYWNDIVFYKHLNNVSNFYYQRKEQMEMYLNLYLYNLCKWNTPQGGMFFWLNIEGIDDSELLIKEKARNEKILLLPGKVFYADHDDRSKKCSFVRVSFSVASEKQMNDGISRFANILKQPKC